MKQTKKEKLIAQAIKLGHTVTQLEKDTCLELVMRQTILTKDKDVVLVQTHAGQCLIVDGRKVSMEIMFYELSENKNVKDKTFSTSDLGMEINDLEDGEIYEAD